ncbi:MAG: DHH family phosphoesterase, partial [candidate division WWE3 bacterium]|nr:DHH family phosphoesterase [candidate division WWE3 bacterium]
MMQKRWEVVSERVPENGKQVREILLKNRKIQNPREFFSPPEPSYLVSQLPVQFPDLDLRQLERAADRIKKAITAGEKITVWGDYDVDGVCATAVLWQTLHGLGADVLPYIPDRFKEGYGLNSSGIQRLAQDGRSLIITVDSGITAQEEAQTAKKAGVDLIITDHHLKPKLLPETFAIVHTTQLCGTGVAWLLASHLNPSSKGGSASGG